jgi:hypothetical protein
MQLRLILLRHYVAGHGRPSDRQHHRLFLGKPGMVDSASPDDVITLLCQEDTVAGECHAEAAANEDQESCPFLAFHPLHPLVTRRVDTPFDLYSLTVARIVSVLEVPQEPSPVQCRILACVAHIHIFVHAPGR